MNNVFSRPRFPPNKQKKSSPSLNRPSAGWGFTPPLKLRTTEFRQAVCNIMLAIPYGRTMTYGKIAEIVARRKGVPRMSAQAVGGAVGHNPVSMIVPCHRVIGANGALVGYGGGLDRKAALLTLEHADLSGDFVP